MVRKARLLGEAEPVSLVHLSRSDVDELRRYHLEARRHGEKILACLECHGPLHPRRRQFGPADVLDTFAHDPGAHQTCVLARSGESVRHEVLKDVICKTAGRVAGFSADVEVRGDGVDPDTGFPPVVDVVATNVADRSRHGWEVQLSPQTDALVYRRQEVRASFLAQCSWETTGDRPVWADRVPWLGLELDDQTWRVTGGLVVRRRLPDGSTDYAPADPELLTRVVGDQLRRNQRGLTWVEGLGWCRLAEPSEPGVRRPRAPVVCSIDHNPTEVCTRPPVVEDLGAPTSPTKAPKRRTLGEILAERSALAGPAPAPTAWRPRSNLPDLVPMSEAEHRAAKSSQRLVTAPFRRALLSGGPCGCTG